MKPFDASLVPLEGRMLVEASAGTGKTHAITTLVLRFLLEAQLPIERILVVTFTEAATAELRGRVRARLVEALFAIDSQDDVAPELAAILLCACTREGADKVRLRLRRALQDVDDAAISTIHGFCQRTLRDSAFDTGNRFDAELAADLSQLQDEVIHDLWVRLLRDADPDTLDALAQGGVTPSACESLLVEVTRSPDRLVLPRAVELPAVDRAAFERAFDELRSRWHADSVAERIVAAKLGKSYTRRWVPTWCADIAALLARGPERRIPDNLARFTASALEQAGAKRSLWSDPVFVAADEVCSHAALQASWARARVIAFKRQFADAALVELPRRKERRGVYGFDDLLLTLARALASRAGPLIAEQVRRRYPAALVDEFQDTDPVQWSIFDRIWRGGSLVLIGDPKQAIYSFRGADVFSYLAAARSVPLERHYTMQVNWRSDPSLIAAVHRVFDGVLRPMLLPEIGYPMVEARPAAHDRFRGTARIGHAPLRVVFARREGKRKNEGALVDRVADFIAKDVYELVQSGRIGDSAVAPGDIAVLTRTNAQASKVARALARFGVRSVVHGDASVYDSDDAENVECFLRAVADPSDDGAVRAALITPLCGFDAAELVAMEVEPATWELWVQRFRELAHLWSQRGVMAMYRSFAAAVALPSLLLELPDGERRMTNVRQLFELLHTAERAMHFGPRALLAWLSLRSRSDEPRSEDAQIRLESDECAVQLTTVHRSKGLEYPIVYAPYLWDGKLFRWRKRKRGQVASRKGEVLVHDPTHERRELHLLSGMESAAELRASPVFRRAALEQLAENLRIVYVALTRAKHHVTLVWSAASDFETAALGYLLHGADIQGDGVDAIRAALEPLEDEALLADLARLSERASGCIEIAPLVDDEVAPRAPSPKPSATLACRTLSRRIDSWWRIASFSQLSSAKRSIALEPGEDLDRDDPSPSAPAPVLADSTRPTLLAEFPRGRTAGNFFHEILVQIDFTRGDSEHAHALIESKLASYGYEPAWRPLVGRAVCEMLATPLDGRGMRLCDVAPEQRKNELEFHLPVAHESIVCGDQLALPLGDRPKASAALTSHQLALPFKAFPSGAIPRDYHERVKQLSFLPLEGYLKGYIDLVFTHLGRWYLVDYKTNHLGDDLSAYQPERLKEAMAHGHYFLQYHLYAVALHRWLSRRVGSYSYAKHFGGVFYLFLKGMTPATAASSGVFFEKPPHARIEAFSRLLASGRLAQP
jgi:exodeoxyribonuclease V beta subunit